MAMLAEIEKQVEKRKKPWSCDVIIPMYEEDDEIRQALLLFTD